MRMLPVALVFACVFACALALPGAVAAQGMSAMTGHDAAAAGSSTAAGALADSMRVMDEGMAQAAMTGDADADFVRMMLAHHKGAVSMAKVELQYGKDADLKALAGRIVAAQEAEITQMQAWLDAHKGR